VRVLTRHGLSLRMLGGGGDMGVDFGGFWMIGDRAHRVVGQCKHVQRRVGGREVRVVSSFCFVVGLVCVVCFLLIVGFLLFFVLFSIFHFGDYCLFICMGERRRERDGERKS